MVNYCKGILEGIISVVVNLIETAGDCFTSSDTLKHCDEISPEKNRGRLLINWEDCIGCGLCAEACPVRCISIDTVPAGPQEELGITSDGRKKEVWVLEFDIDLAKCFFCGFCVLPCPTECISMTDEYNYFVYNRNNLIYHFTPFTPEQAMKKRKNLETATDKIFREK